MITDKRALLVYNPATVCLRLPCIMIKEIGSEFWNVPVLERGNSLFPKSTQWFLAGRSALQSIVKDLLLKGKKTVAMPSWCCDSMIKPFVDSGMNVSFYPVFFSKGFYQDINTDCDVLFLMDYLGFTSNVTVSHSCIIRDITHSIFSNTYKDAAYYFGSLRKWCGVWTGGFAWTKDGQQLKIVDGNNAEYVKQRKEAMELKDCYINCKLDIDGNEVRDKLFLPIFGEAEQKLENADAVSADERDVILAKHLDVEFIKTRRRKNAKILMQEFTEQLFFPILNEDDCPLFVPILVPQGKRNELRQYLIQHEIYCPIHWMETKYHRLDARTKFIYNNELSLVCDQRYTEEDMFRIVDTIHQFWKEI